jgi:DNA-binding CsgD family transcriptional regulator
VASLFAQVAAGSDSTRLWLPGAILLHCELGQADAARRLLDRLGDADKLPRDDLYTPSLVYLADAALMLNDTARAERLLEALRPFRGLNLSLLGTVALGSGAGYMAALAAMLRRGKESRVLFEEALAFNSRMRAPPLVARTQVDYAALLERSDKPADVERAGRLARDALVIAERFGMIKLAARARELLDGVPQAEALTEREREILHRIAAGASNKRIAMDLRISVTTVATHIRSVLRKTGTANRTEAAAHARRHNMFASNREGDSR